MEPPALPFGPHGPFDPDEQAAIQRIVAAAARAARPGSEQLLAAVAQRIAWLERLGATIAQLPSLFTVEMLGERRRDLDSLVDLISSSNLSNFQMFLPTRALMASTLVLAEVNFYRLLRLVCLEAVPGEERTAELARMDRLLCQCIYTRLAEEVLKHIASDGRVRRDVREQAVRALARIWEHNAYRVQDFFPVLQATWDARRRVPATLGTLMGTTEMFGLLREGCDPAFVQYLVRPELSEDEAAAFREFLFGARTEQLHLWEAELAASGRSCLSHRDVADTSVIVDPHRSRRDPASAMFEFFLSRHLQAGARRLADLPGPQRTAEEYVMLHYLEQQVPLPHPT